VSAIIERDWRADERAAQPTPAPPGLEPPPARAPARSWRRRRWAVAGVTVLAAVSMAGVAVASPGSQRPAPSDDGGLSLLSNGHHHASVEVALDPATRVLIDRQLRGTQALKRNYPTVAAALAGGYQRVGPYLPGIGAHYAHTEPLLAGEAEVVGSDGLITAEGADKPFLIYAGNDPTSPLTGFMYLSLRDPALGVPEGFAGPDDVWHQHENLCIVTPPDGTLEVPFGTDATIDKAQCDAFAGELLVPAPFMVHVWNVPGWEPPGGLFADINPKLDCPDGTYRQRPVAEWPALLSTCASS
jgi:hypothetical protein